MQLLSTTRSRYLSRILAVLCALTDPTLSTAYISGAGKGLKIGQNNENVRLSIISIKQRIETSSVPFAKLTELKMSSIPGDDEDNRGMSRKQRSERGFMAELSEVFYKKLPPFPENTIILGGDVGWLFFYSFLDHSLHDLFVAATASQEPNIVGIHAAWIDVMNKPAEFMAASAEYGMAEPYSPALALPGICAVMFATLWLLNGYFQESFAFKNTVTCDTHTAVKVAGKLWVTTAIGMLAIAYASDAMGLAGLQHQVGGLTQTDLDFVLSSLPVMVCWRWMVAWILNNF